MTQVNDTFLGRHIGYLILDFDCIDLNRAKSSAADSIGLDSSRRHLKHRLSFTTTSLERIASRIITMDQTLSHCRPAPSLSRMPLSKDLALPNLSSNATVGRNSQFHNLTERDRELLGGIEYRSLKLLLKIVTGKIFLLGTGIDLE